VTTPDVLGDALLAVLACPRSKQPLVYFSRGEDDAAGTAGFLLCPASRLRYRVDGGVPVMLVEEADELPAAEVERLLARARELGFAVPS